MRVNKQTRPSAWAISTTIDRTNDDSIYLLAHCDFCSHYFLTLLSPFNMDAVAGTPPLGQSYGYGIVLGLGFAFAFGKFPCF